MTGFYACEVGKTESWVEGAEAGVEVAGGGDRGSGIVAGSLEILGGKLIFYRKSKKMAHYDAVLGPYMYTIKWSCKGNIHLCVGYFVTRPT